MTLFGESRELSVPWSGSEAEEMPLVTELLFDAEQTSKFDPLEPFAQAYEGRAKLPLSLALDPREIEKRFKASLKPGHMERLLQREDHRAFWLLRDTIRGATLTEIRSAASRASVTPLPVTDASRRYAVSMEWRGVPVRATIRITAMQYAAAKDPPRELEREIEYCVHRIAATITDYRTAFAMRTRFKPVTLATFLETVRSRSL